MHYGSGAQFGIVANILGHQGVGDHVPLGDAIGTRWRDQYRGSDYAQQQSCCRQVSNAYHRKAPPFFCPRDGLSFTPGGHSHVMPVSYFILCDLWTYVTFGRAVALRAVNTLPASASKRERQDASCCLSVK